MKKIKKLFISVIFILLISTILITNPVHALVIGNSSLTGLFELKAMTKLSVPYEVAMNNSKATFLEFYADWCTSCQSMAHVINELHQEYSHQLNFVMINIDDPKWKEIIREYQVNGIPQFNLLDTKHNNMKTLIGRVPELILHDYIQQITINY